MVGPSRKEGLGEGRKREWGAKRKMAYTGSGIVGLFFGWLLLNMGIDDLGREGDVTLGLIYISVALLLLGAALYFAWYVAVIGFVAANIIAAIAFVTSGETWLLVNIWTFDWLREPVENFLPSIF